MPQGQKGAEMFRKGGLISVSAVPSGHANFLALSEHHQECIRQKRFVFFGHLIQKVTLSYVLN